MKNRDIELKKAQQKLSPNRVQNDQKQAIASLLDQCDDSVKAEVQMASVSAGVNHKSWVKALVSNKGIIRIFLIVLDDMLQGRP